MFDNQQFIAATDFIKNTKKITFGQIAERLEIERHILDNIRRGSQAPSAGIVNLLVERFPDSAKFFASKPLNTDTVEEPMIMYSDGRAWKELAETQKKLLEALEHRMIKAEAENMELRVEVRLLRERCLELEKQKKE